MIRDINPDDIKACSVVFIETYNGAPWNDQWTDAAAQAYLSEMVHHPRFFGLAVIENDCIIGACFCREKIWWSGDEIYIDEFFISPKKQRIGYGKELMNAVMQYAASKNIKCITLLTDQRKPAFDFYCKLGFQCLDHQLFMYKNL